MKLRLIIICFGLASIFASETNAAPTVPKPLTIQIQRLVDLLSDGYAVGYPKATIFQTVKTKKNNEITLAVFTVEGFGGGNNFSQYFAVFSPETTENGKQQFMLIDVIPIGGGGWRSIEKLNAKTTADPKTDEVTIAIDALENTGDDAPNFPSKKITINLMLKNGRLNEKK
jgi:hypothetical protein